MTILHKNDKETITVLKKELLKEARKPQRPTIKVEEKKLTPLIAREEIPFEWIENIADWDDTTGKAITTSLTGQLVDELQKRVEVEIDPKRRMYVTKLRIWVDKK